MCLCFNSSENSVHTNMKLINIDYHSEINAIRITEINAVRMLLCHKYKCHDNKYKCHNNKYKCHKYKYNCHKCHKYNVIITEINAIRMLLM